VGAHQSQRLVEIRTAVQRAVMNEPIAAESIEDSHMVVLSARIAEDARRIVQERIRRHGCGDQQDEAQQ
jgi:hypothetical protein